MKNYIATLPLFIILLFLNINIKGQENTDKQIYVCPPCNSKCDTKQFDSPGNCNHCNMKLIKEEDLKKQSIMKRKKIGLYIQDGVEILDLAGPMEVFSYAGYEIFTISKSKDNIYAQGILTVTPDYDLSDAPQADVLVFFGGNATKPSKDKAVIEWLQSQKDTEYYFSVCSGAKILAEAGLLDGKQATTFRQTLNTLEKNFPKIEVLRGVRYVDNGKVITTAGVSAGIDGALHMVAKFEGLATAAQTALFMEYDWVPNQGIAYAKDNPYLEMNNTTLLKEYTGSYASKNGKRMILSLNNTEKELILNINNKKYVVFYITKNKLLVSKASHMLTFTRDDNNNIINVETTEYKETFSKED